MRMIFLIVCLVAAGCGPDPDAMTNDQIIAETAKCRIAGLKAQALVRGIDGSRIIKIQCSPTT